MLPMSEGRTSVWVTHHRPLTSPEVITTKSRQEFPCPLGDLINSATMGCCLRRLGTSHEHNASVSKATGILPYTMAALVALCQRSSLSHSVQ